MPKGLTRDEIARVVACDLPDGAYVNLGIGVPTLIADFLPPGKGVQLHSEQGLLGLGPKPEPGKEDPDVVNAGKQFVTLLPGASVFSHSDSFLMVRGGHIDVACLGAFQVSAEGNLANWATNDPNVIPGVGGAMDLAAGAKRVWVLMEHCTRDGTPRIVRRCTYPLTAPRCVERVYTNYAMMAITREGIVVERLAPDMTFEQLQACTDAPLTLSRMCVPY